jgi:hypothetical protein
MQFNGLALGDDASTVTVTGQIAPLATVSTPASGGLVIPFTDPVTGQIFQITLGSPVTVTDSAGYILTFDTNGNLVSSVPPGTNPTQTSTPSTPAPNTTGCSTWQQMTCNGLCLTSSLPFYCSWSMGAVVAVGIAAGALIIGLSSMGGKRRR